MKYVQILFYYVQDASLFMVLLPQTEQQNDNILQQILLFSPPLSALYTKASTFCLSEETTVVTKIFIIYLFGPFVILLLFMLFLFHKLILFVKGYSNTQRMFSLAISQAFLLAILLSFQQIIKGSLSLVQCVGVYEDKFLLVQGNIECYTWWQIMVKLFIYLHIGPLILVFSILPLRVQERKMARKVFILACFLPTPVIIYVCIRGLLKKMRGKRISIEVREVDEINVSIEVREVDEINVTTDSVSLKSSRDIIVHALLYHYRCLEFCGLKFTWLGIHKLNRLLLVVCNAYIPGTVARLLAMTSILMIITIGNIFLKPYKDSRTNKTATLSYMANMANNHKSMEGYIGYI